MEEVVAVYQKDSHTDQNPKEAVVEAIEILWNMLLHHLHLSPEPPRKFLLRPARPAMSPRVELYSTDPSLGCAHRRVLEEGAVVAACPVFVMADKNSLGTVSHTYRSEEPLCSACWRVVAVDGPWAVVRYRLSCRILSPIQEELLR